MKKNITIIGLTVSGNTALTVELARKLNGEVIGLDSGLNCRSNMVFTP